MDRSKAHVVVMNHQSLLDILFVFTLFYPAKMMAKKALAAVPVVGWTLFLNDHIFIDRANRKSQIDALRRMDQLLLDGDSLMVYPEGTRTMDGNIAEFKKGAFRSAVSTGTSVLPVVIDGAFNALPRKTMVVKGCHTITMSVLPEIPVEKGSATADLALKCHDIMSAELRRLQQR
ncbi:MAG: 1-acyl-sn-glycerol-3-phosphate acyltransferase [Spirochaetales bacterium]|nr:1-acyl-sn-glycerol-3-phosphate acyltransferase [Spirochaetales bacterium]